MAKLTTNMSAEFVPEWNTTKFQGATNIAISDSFAMRLAASYEESDGWMENQLTKQRRAKHRGNISKSNVSLGVR